MPVDHSLVPMFADDFAAYAVDAMSDYATDKVRSGQWSADEAPALAREAFAALLPGGVATPGHHLFHIRDDASGNDVGALWFAIEPRGGRPIAYLYDIVIAAEHRRRGHATAAFVALEREVARRGLGGIALHVFGHNEAARALYAKLGFVTTNLDLFRPLGGKP